MTGLVVFEAAARCLSFTIAARELNVTQAAVSQQVRALERELGVSLFKRDNRRLVLSDTGRVLCRAVSMGLECMTAGINEVRASQKPTIVVGTSNAIARFWLIPRLQDFRLHYPDIDVSIETTDRGFDVVADSIDAGLVFGRGTWAGFRAARLREGDVFPVCSPAYLRSRPAPAEIAELLDETLLVLDSHVATAVDWPQWFASHGIRSRYYRRIKFNNLSLLLEAACEGQGIALGWSLLTDVLLERGALVRALPSVLQTEGSYYFIVAEKSNRPEVIAFQNWVLDQFPQGDCHADKILPLAQGARGN
ncbi:MAG: LysR substrate-binding domain-containing protein [Lautropia sp.]